MTRKELLQGYYENEMNVVFNLSNDYLMNTPKKGCEEEWKRAKEKADMLEDMIKEAE